MKANEFLMEDRNSFVADQLGDKLMSAYEEDHGVKPELKTPLDIVTVLSKVNPKLVQWLANKYIGEEFKLEDLDIIKDAITRFIQVRARLPDEQKDLNKLSLGDLYRAIAPFEDKEVISNKQAARNKKQKFMDDGDAELIYKDKTLVILTPKTEEASCYFGVDTKWCTSGTQYQNAFDSYNRDGNLYIIMTKTDGKFQVHLERGEFNDALNNMLTPEGITAFVKKYPKMLDVFDKPATKALYLPLIKNPSEEVQVAAIIKGDPSAIRHIENPSMAAQMAAIKANGLMIKHIKNPSDEVVRAAIDKTPRAIEYIKNPSEELQLLAVSRKPVMGSAIQYIDNPSEAVQLAATSWSGLALRYIANPTEAVQMAAVTNKGVSLKMIDYPTPAVELAAVKNQGRAIVYVENQTEEMQLIAVTGTPAYIGYCDNPSDKVLRAAGK